jgi:hypothetical protein
MRWPLLLVLLLAPILAGCDSFDEWWHKGTIKGYNICKAAGEKEGLSAFSVRGICVERHQKRVDEVTEGTARYSSVPGGVAFTGSITNKRGSVIITEYTVVVTHTLAKERQSRTFTNKWIEPEGTDSFRIDATGLKYQPPEDQRHRDKFEWFLSGVKGIEISF